MTIGSNPRPDLGIAEDLASWEVAAGPFPPPGTASPAERIVLLCSCRALSPDDANQLRELGAMLDEAAWRTVQHMAQVHGVAPLVFTHLAVAGLLPAIPVPVTAALADEYRRTLVTNKHLRKALLQVVDALSAHAIDVIALKGVALAARYYGDIGLRPAGDIDLLVRRVDLRAAGRVLQRLGYRAAHGQAQALDFTALVFAELSYTREDNTHVELHWELTHQPAYRQALPVADAWLRSEEHPLDGRRVRCLGAEDELRFLCTHCAADHQLDRLLWLVDIAELVRSLPAGWEWASFVRTSIAARLAVPVASALAACHAQLGLALPPEVLPALRVAAASPAEQKAWHAAQAELFSQDGLRAHLGALRGAADVLAFLRGVFAPGPAKLRQVYGSQAGQGLHLPLVYIRHWGRMARRVATLLLEPSGALRRIRLRRAM